MPTSSQFLYHCFPRQSGAGRLPPESPASIVRSQAEADAKGLGILRSILSRGLLCSPEALEIKGTDWPTLSSKQALARAGAPYTRIIQSRACFSLSTRKELSVQRSEALNADDESSFRRRSHLDSFGHFAIALTNAAGRRLGIKPVHYYYEQPGVSGVARKESSAGIALLERLYDIRILLSAVAQIEARAGGDNPSSESFLTREALAHVGLNLGFEDDVQRSEAIGVFELLDTDRQPAWVLADSIDYLLSMFQTADSRTGKELRYWQQREWRLVHHKTQHLEWERMPLESLSSDVPSRRQPERGGLHEGENLDDLSASSGRFILRAIRGEHFRHYIDHVLAPRPCLAVVRRMIGEFDWPRTPPGVLASS